MDHMFARNNLGLLHSRDYNRRAELNWLKDLLYCPFILFISEAAHLVSQCLWRSSAKNSVKLKQS